MADTPTLTDAQSGYRFKPHELPFLPGSPANPDHPARRRIAYLLIGLFLGVVGGAQNGLLIANAPALRAEMALTPQESGWLTVAFYSTYACMSMLLFRVRQEFGIQPFVRWAMVGLVMANIVQVAELGFYAELAARAVAGIAAAGLTALSLYYLMQGLPPTARVGGIVITLALVQIAVPLARAISPALLVDGDMSRVFQLQFALSLVSLGAVVMLRLPPGLRQGTFELLDLPSIALFMAGVSALCAFLVQGQIMWWTTPWLGWALALALLCLGGCVLIEASRKRPMLDIGWLSSRSILALVAVGVTVRVLVSEQGFGASGLFSALGFGGEQLVGYFWVLTGASFGGMALSLVRLDPQDLTRPVLFAVAVIALAAFADISTGTLSRPQDLYWTQAAIAFAAIFAMGPVMMEGMLRALAAGPQYVISFIAVFSLSQSIGGLAGLAALSAFHQIRLKTHLIDAAGTLTAANTQLVQAIGQSARAIGPTQSDAALQQQAAAATVSQQVGREAAVLAFNDVFFLIGVLASIAFVLIGIPWIINRIRGRNPLAKELAYLEAVLARTRT